MGRRHLFRDEAEIALRRGATIECFIGACERDARRGVRHVSIRMVNDTIVMQLIESEDLGNPDFLDIYAFGPLDPKVEFGDPDQVIRFASFDQCLADMDRRWPGKSSQMVNEGVLQDEYREYLGRRLA